MDEKGSGLPGIFFTEKKGFRFPLTNRCFASAPFAQWRLFREKKADFPMWFFTGGSVELGWVRPTFVFFCYLFSAASQSIYIVRSTVKCMKKGEKKTCIDMKVVKAGEEGVWVCLVIDVHTYLVYAARFFCGRANFFFVTRTIFSPDQKNAFFRPKPIKNQVLSLLFCKIGKKNFGKHTKKSLLGNAKKPF